jgi:hypothetical protein
MSDVIYHTVIWTETDTGITMSLGLEGTLITRADAERVAQAYRDLLAVGYEVDGNPDMAWRSRVGIVEMPAPDPRLKHPEPNRDVDQIVLGLTARAEQKRTKKLEA